eukprot:9459905-Karenia_brevis.AAC.1
MTSDAKRAAMRHFRLLTFVTQSSSFAFSSWSSTCFVVLRNQSIQDSISWLDVSSLASLSEAALDSEVALET